MTELIFQANFSRGTERCQGAWTKLYYLGAACPRKVLNKFGISNVLLPFETRVSVPLKGQMLNFLPFPVKLGEGGHNFRENI